MSLETETYEGVIAKARASLAEALPLIAASEIAALSPGQLLDELNAVDEAWGNPTPADVERRDAITALSNLIATIA